MRGRMLLLLAATALTALGGCTGTQMAVRPELDLEGAQPKYDGACGRVAVREVAPARVYPPAGNLVPGFADALRESGVAKTVYYPTRPDDVVDVTLDARFDVAFEPNMGANMGKSFVTGLTLFLLEPLMWFDYDYTLQGEVGVYRGPVKAYTVRSEAEAEMQMKFLSLGQAVSLEGETLAKAKRTLYRQLLVELDRACSSP